MFRGAPLKLASGMDLPWREAISIFMAQAFGALRPLNRAQFETTLAWALGLVFALHFALLLALRQHALLPSQACTALFGIVAAVCVLRRSSLLASHERMVWMWPGVAILFWSAARLALMFSGNAAANDLRVDASDFLYICAILTLLAAFGGTREIQSTRIIVILNSIQVALGLVLSYVLLYRTPAAAMLSPAAVSRIYGGAGVLLAGMSVLRSFVWSSAEERVCVRWTSISLWTYAAIELAIGWAITHRGLRAGTFADLAWSIPFALIAWKALTLPIEAADESPVPEASRLSTVIESLCPFLLNAGVFALAAGTVTQHVELGIVAMFALLMIQGLHAVVVRLHYAAGRKRLLQREGELRSANAALEELALLDPLTGIANRRRFEAALQTSWRRALRRRHPVALLMVDVDFFKGVNDLHGHAYGDECLTALAKVMSQQARRPDDLVARIGGEEFVLLLPDTDDAGASLIARRLHDAICQLAVVNQASPFNRLLTVSIGQVVCMPRMELDPSTLVEAADRALYVAKGKGRNRTSVSTLL